MSHDHAKSNVFNREKNPNARHFVRKHEIADLFERKGLEKQATALRCCEEFAAQVACTTCANSWYVVDRCRMRVCPLCGFRDNRRRTRYLMAVCQKVQKPKFTTLTMRRWRGEPREGIKFIREKFNELRKTFVFDHITGGGGQVELEWKPDGWHIHIHLIHDGPFLPKKRLAWQWGKLLGGYWPQVKTKGVQGPEAFAYVCKYVTKGTDFKRANSKIVEWYLATKGSRLFFTFGIFYNVAIEELDPTMHPKDQKTPCRDCGEIGTKIIAKFLDARNDEQYALLSEISQYGPVCVPCWDAEGTQTLVQSAITQKGLEARGPSPRVQRFATPAPVETRTEQQTLPF
jgi:hypothetical protein